MSSINNWYYEFMLEQNDQSVTKDVSNFHFVSYRLISLVNRLQYIPILGPEDVSGSVWICLVKWGIEEDRKYAKQCYTISFRLTSAFLRLVSCLSYWVRLLGMQVSSVIMLWDVGISSCWTPKFGRNSGIPWIQFMVSKEVVKRSELYR